MRQFILILAPVLAAFLTIGCVPIACADVFEVVEKDVDFDRWFYVFNQSPGIRPEGSTFAAPLSDPNEDNRHGVVLVGFDTSIDVPAGLGASSYQISSATLTMFTSREVENDDGSFRGEFRHDPTFDPLASYLDPTQDLSLIHI